MLSSQARQLTYALAAVYAVLGASLFLAPDWASSHFAWTVSPFVAMTIGGWCLGNAWAAYIVARRWRFPLIAATLTYLVSFGILETAVALAFFDKLRLDHWLAWLYIAALTTNIAAVALWGRDYFVLGPEIKPVGRIYGPADFALGAGAGLFVAFLGLYGLFAARGHGGGIFPEVLSPFSVRSFGAFYLSVSLGLVPLLFVRGVDNTMSHLFASWGLLVFITLASFVYIGVFSFAERPGQMLYLGTYLATAAVTGLYMWRYGTGLNSRAPHGA